MTEPQAPHPRTATAAQPELGLTMTQILRNPLAALRAQMESLAGEFRGDDPRQVQLRGALEHVLKLSRDVDALVRYASPRELAPLDCSVDEIVHSALRALRYEHSARVKLALGSSGARLMVDGPVLSDCLGRLLENALNNGDDWVLLSAGGDESWARFSIVEGGRDASYEGQHRAGLPEHRSAALALGLLVARREIERMHGKLEVAHTPLGNTCVTVSIPVGAAVQS